MNNKGLTLVEVIAVLVVLSIIAVIVTPNIAVSIKDYKNRVLQTQLNSIEGATKNWVADNIDKVPCDTAAIKISLSELQTDAYIDQNIKNPTGDFDNAFGLVYCKTIVDETDNLSSNYKYSYGAYEDMDDYIQKMAVKYAKKNKVKTNTTVSTSDLVSGGFIYSTIKDTEGNNVTVGSKTVSIVPEEQDDGTYVFKTTIE